MFKRQPIHNGVLLTQLYSVSCSQCYLYETELQFKLSSSLSTKYADKVYPFYSHIFGRIRQFIPMFLLELAYLSLLEKSQVRHMKLFNKNLKTHPCQIRS